MAPWTNSFRRDSCRAALHLVRINKPCRSTDVTTVLFSARTLSWEPPNRSDDTCSASKAAECLPFSRTYCRVTRYPPTPPQRRLATLHPTEPFEYQSKGLDIQEHWYWRVEFTADHQRLEWVSPGISSDGNYGIHHRLPTHHQAIYQRSLTLQPAAATYGLCQRTSSLRYHIQFRRKLSADTRTTRIPLTI